MYRKLRLVAACAIGALLGALALVEPAFADGKSASDIGKDLQGWFADLGIWILLLVLGFVGIGAAVERKWGLLLSAGGISLVAATFLLNPEGVRDLMDKFVGDIF